MLGTGLGKVTYSAYRYYHDERVAYEEAIPKEPKEFKEGEHVFPQIYGFEDQIEIPDGYHILEVEPNIVPIGSGAKTIGYVVFYINDEPVVVESSYNEEKHEYDYHTPGRVIEKETTKVLKKIKIKKSFIFRKNVIK